MSLGPVLAPVIDVSEIRTIRADQLWMSPAYARDVVGLHFSWRKDAAGVAAVLPTLEAALEPFEPVPHWGKLFVTEPGMIGRHYPRLADFRTLCRDLDPDAKFTNRFVRDLLEGSVR